MRHPLVPTSFLTGLSCTSIRPGDTQRCGADTYVGGRDQRSIDGSDDCADCATRHGRTVTTCVVCGALTATTPDRTTRCTRHPEWQVQGIDIPRRHHQ